VHEAEEERIITLRRSRKLGIKRLRNELHRQYVLRLAIDTIHKVLCRHGLNRLKRPRLVRKKGGKSGIHVLCQATGCRWMSARLGRVSTSRRPSTTVRDIRLLPRLRESRRPRRWPFSIRSSRKWGLSDILCLRPVSSLSDEPFAEYDGELGFGLKPFARRPFPFFRRTVQDEA